MQNEGSSRVEGLNPRAARILRLATRLTGRSQERSETLERILLIVAALVFLVATVVAWKGIPSRDLDFSPLWALVALGLAGGTLWVKALEFGLSGTLLGRSLARAETFRVSVVGSAANFLPIPGAALVRTRALRQQGEHMGTALAVTAAVGVAWVGTAAILAGLLQLLPGGSALLGLIFSFAGLLSWILVLGIVRGSGRRVKAGEMASLFGIEMVSVSLSGCRLFAVARSGGFPVGFVDSVTVSLGAILAHVPGIFPGGLGLRELSAGLFGSFAGVPGSIGVLMSVLDRLFLYVVMGMAVAVLLSTGKHGENRPGIRKGKRHTE